MKLSRYLLLTGLLLSSPIFANVEIQDSKHEFSSKKLAAVAIVGASCPVYYYGGLKWGNAALGGIFIVYAFYLNTF